MGRVVHRELKFNWEALNLPPGDLHGIDAPFTNDEIKAAINDVSSHKALEPDGFTTEFFKSCWEIIKDDVMSIINLFSDLQVAHFQWLNSTNIVLPPKKDGVEDILDYRPTSLIHAIAKIVAKMLASCLPLTWMPWFPVCKVPSQDEKHP